VEVAWSYGGCGGMVVAWSSWWWHGGSMAVVAMRWWYGGGGMLMTVVVVGKGEGGEACSAVVVVQTLALEWRARTSAPQFTSRHSSKRTVAERFLHIVELAAVLHVEHIVPCKYTAGGASKNRQMAVISRVFGGRAQRSAYHAPPGGVTSRVVNRAGSRVPNPPTLYSTPTPVHVAHQQRCPRVTGL